MFKLLKSVSQQLEQNGIEYMLSGSMAMNLYTTPRMTRDIDIVINLQMRHLEKFMGIFEHGFYIFKPSIIEEIKRIGMFNVIHHESGHKIDFIIRKQTEFNIIEFERRRKMKFLDFELWVVSIEDLILSKLKWIQLIESEQQKRDISNLLSVENINLDYIRVWCRNLKLKTYNLI